MDNSEYNPPPPSSFAATLREAWKRSGKSQAELARATEVGPSLVWQWLNGKRPVPAYKASRLAHVLGNVGAGEISEAYSKLLGVDPEHRPFTVSDRDLVRDNPLIPGGGDAAAVFVDEADFHARDGEDPALHPTGVRIAFPLDADLAAHVAGTTLPMFAVRATDDAMTPTIGAGDLVLVDPHQRVIRDGTVYAFVAGSVMKMRRLRTRVDGTIAVSSDSSNKQLHPDESVEGEAIEVYGRCIYRLGAL